MSSTSRSPSTPRGIDRASASHPRATCCLAGAWPSPLHEAFVDGPALLHLPLRLRFVVREELLGYRVLGPMLRLARQIALCPERGVEGYRRMLRGAAAAFARGESVVVFPQGTVLGIESTFQAGAFHLARALARPILPVALTGGHRVYEYPFTPRLREGQPMSLRVLPPVSRAEVLTTEPAALCERLQRLLKAHALDGRMAPPRHYVPARDGYWDDYAFEIDAAFDVLAADLARHRAERAGRAAPGPSASVAAGGSTSARRAVPRAEGIR